MEIGFDNQSYVTQQTKYIIERIKNSPGNKLYLEFGGKLFDDRHASRVLPGFDPNAKIKILKTLKAKAELIITISAIDLDRNKIRSDSFIDYGTDVFRMIDLFKKNRLKVNSVVITQYNNQKSADTFKKKLERRNIKVYIHTRTKGYPNKIDTIISDDGYGQNEYINTTKPLVIVTAPGPGSGKLATCLCQLYHEYKQGKRAGYAKFETFPVWNLPLKHPVNIAYEAATADLKDVNMVDSYHLTAYGITSVNYNRDIEIFPVVKTIINKIMKNGILYKSPTDMGVNMVGDAIVNEEVVSKAAKREVIRRYFQAKCDYLQGLNEKDTEERISYLLGELGIDIEDREVVKIARKKSKTYKTSILAIEMKDGVIVTGKESKILTASSACILNAIKYISGIDDDVELISRDILSPILSMKKKLYNDTGVLTLNEVILALSICAINNSQAKDALDALDKLSCCDAHASCILNNADSVYLHKLNVYLSEEPQFLSVDTDDDIE